MVSIASPEEFTRRHRERASERLMMRRLFFVVYPLCLAVVTVTRLGKLLAPRDGTIEGSVFAEARASAYALLGYAFSV
ncbi:hypothetical protein [Breoghania sp. JC706]|uniref:hypothetical protein n=1 Tax=Breoghania sp. JC706 TaxID=3117732 RepID=UPI00300B734D